MKEEFVSYQQAKALKECGFDWECDYHYDFVIDSSPILQTPTRNSDLMEHCVAVPSLSLAQKWLREVKGIFIEPTFIYKDNFELIIKSQRYNIFKVIENKFDSYESSLSAGISAVLNLLTEKQCR